MEVLGSSRRPSRMVQGEESEEGTGRCWTSTRHRAPGGHCHWGGPLHHPLGEALVAWILLVRSRARGWSAAPTRPQPWTNTRNVTWICVCPTLGLGAGQCFWSRCHRPPVIFPGCRHRSSSWPCIAPDSLRVSTYPSAKREVRPGSGILVEADGGGGAISTALTSSGSSLQPGPHPQTPRAAPGGRELGPEGRTPESTQASRHQARRPELRRCIKKNDPRLPKQKGILTRLFLALLK